jgi:hypothetical protein
VLARHRLRDQVKDLEFIACPVFCAHARGISNLSGLQ